MTKVKIDPGACGFVTSAEAISEDGLNVAIAVRSGCEAVTKMFDELGGSFDSYEICLAKPGGGPLYEYASAKFPGHCCCPVISGVIKAAEVECKLAVKKDVAITFED